MSNHKSYLHLLTKEGDKKHISLAMVESQRKKYGIEVSRSLSRQLRTIGGELLMSRQSHCLNESLRLRLFALK